MKLKHKTPCHECPWRKAAPAGYLGGFPAEYYADAVAANEIPACHLKDFGPDDPRTAMCAGSLATAANACILPDRTVGGVEARDKVGKREDCFPHPRAFYKHHTREDYVHPLLRKQR